MFKIALPLAAAVASLASPGLAAPRDTNPPVRAVAFHDLDLSTAAGSAALDRRIAAAVSNVCGEAAQTDFAGKYRVRHCRTAALQAAASQRERLLAARSTPATTLAAR